MDNAKIIEIMNWEGKVTLLSEEGRLQDEGVLLEIKRDFYHDGSVSPSGSYDNCKL